MENKINIFEQEEKDEIESQIKRRMEVLNPKIRDFISSQILLDLIKSLTKKYSLNQKEANTVEEIIVFICLCMIEPSDIYILAEDFEKRNTLVQKAIADDILSKIIPSEILEIIKNNWEEDKESLQVRKDSIDFFETPLPPGFNNHEELIDKYLSESFIQNIQSSKKSFIPEKVSQLENIPDIKPMQVKNQEIRKHMENKPSETTVSWEDRLAISNSANPNVTRRTNTDQTLPSLGGNKDHYREIPE